MYIIPPPKSNHFIHESQPQPAVPTSSENTEGKYRTRARLGLMLVGFGVLGTISGAEIPQPSVEVASVFIAGGLGSVVVGAAITIEAGTHSAE